MAEITLYGSRLSPFVEKVARGCARKGVAFALREPRTPLDLRRWNPVTGKMPVAEIEGERIYDSTFILRRLDALVPEPPLFSEDPATAAAQRLLEDWADEGLYWYGMALRWIPANAPRTARALLGGVPAPLRPLLAPVLARQVGGMARAQGMGRLPAEVLAREYGARLEDLERLLGERSFFYAEEPSAADLAVYGQLAMARSPVAPETVAALGARPGLADYMKRVEAAAPG